MGLGEQEITALLILFAQSYRQAQSHRPLPFFDEESLVIIETQR